MEIFSQEFTQKLMDYDWYRESDGVLHFVGGDRGYMTLGETEYTIIRESDVKIIYRAKTEVFDEDSVYEGEEIIIGYQTIDFPYEYKNGRWVFTEYVPINAGSSSDMKKYSPMP